MQHIYLVYNVLRNEERLALMGMPSTLTTRAPAQLTWSRHQAQKQQPKDQVRDPHAGGLTARETGQEAVPVDFIKVPGPQPWGA